MKYAINRRYSGLFMLIVLPFVSSAFALAKTGGDFAAGTPAVAATMNTQINDLYTAANKVNTDGWTFSTGDIGYTAGKLGIGTVSPGAPFEILAPAAMPSVAGVSTNQFFRMRNSPAGTVVLDMGVGNVGSTTWIQSRDSTASTSNYSLLLNPNGGFVGIGTTAPTSQLEVVTAGASNIGIANSYYNSSASAAVFLMRKARGTEAAPSAVAAGDRLANFIAQGHDGTSFATSAQILAVSAEAGNWTATAHGTYLSFWTTTSGTTTNTERMRIDDAGNVGIGTVATGHKLDVSGPVRLGSWLTINDAAGTQRSVAFSSALSVRWRIHVDPTAESGGNAGSEFYIRRFNDAGVANGDALGINRATGAATFTSTDRTTFVGSGGTCVLTGAAGSCTSDIRLKTSLAPLTGNLAKLYEIHGSSYNLIKDMKSGRHIGLIAQDVEKVFPELVSVDQQSGMKMLNYAGLVAPLTEALKELRAEKEAQVLALQRDAQQLQKRASDAEQKLSVALSQSKRDRAVAFGDKAAAEARAGKLEMRLAKIEQMLQNRAVGTAPNSLRARK